MGGLTPDQIFQLGLQHHQAGQFAQAEAYYRQVLASQPCHAEALHYIGLLAHQVGRHEVALKLINEAILLTPHNAACYTNLGSVLQSLGRFEEAVATYHRALALTPEQPEVHYNLANALKYSGRREEALVSYARALELNPGHVRALNNMGNTLKDAGRLDEALACYRRAMPIEPGYADTHYNLGIVLLQVGGVNESIACFRRAIAIKPMDARMHSALLHTLHLRPEYDEAVIREEHRRWSESHATPMRRFIRPHTNDRDPERRIRVGYFSADFRDHPVSLFVAPLFEHHDPRQVEVHCYSAAPVPDAVTERLRVSVEARGIWREVAVLSDEQLADEIRRDGIDILVDLTMHTAGNRLPVFARKPAPVQVSWLAYPGSTGIETIGWRLSDRCIDPCHAESGAPVERVIRLPDVWCCYDPLTDAAPARARTAHWGLSVRFGSFNQLCKINEPTLRLWARVLEEVPDSSLLLVAHEGEHREHYRAMMERAGVSAVRLEFIPRMSRTDYLRAYDRIDIALDPLPHNGMTTTCDAMWMGVPVVSLAGSTPAGRAGVSLLTTVGLPELATRTPDEFVRVAVSLARDLLRLGALREGLRERMRASPLMDAERFSRNLEIALRTMWREWCGAAGDRSSQSPKITLSEGAGRTTIR